MPVEPGTILSHRIFVLDGPIPLLDESHSQELTIAYTDDLLRGLKMERLGPLEFYPAIDLRAPGWSWIQPISTSHTSGHYWSAPGHPNIHIDVYSCMPFSWEEVVRVVHEHFRLLDWTGTLVMREQDLRERAAMHIIGKGKDILRRVELNEASFSLPRPPHRVARPCTLVSTAA
jgi:hypothetical protein